MTSLTATEEILTIAVNDWFNEGCPEIPSLGHTSKRNLLCPAAIGSHGKDVFGVFNPETGRVRYLNVVIPLPSVTREVVDSAILCERARITTECQTYRCRYWQGGCRLGWFVANVNVPEKAAKQSCPISQQCRWNAEYGESICQGCSRVRALPIDDPQNG